MRARFAILIALVLSALPLAAQDRATLVADSVAIAGDNRLVADGGVEVFFRGARLRAARIVYDRGTDRLLINGPIMLEDGGQTVVFADQADLRADLTEGILQSARVVLNQQLQLAANEVQRIGGRYTQLGRTVASSCKICEGDPTPLWEIRASRVVHDQLERQLYFDNAQLRLGGVPVFYLPRLRMPDPTLDRANGFLFPTARATSRLGYGLKLPYFLALGPRRDITLTPYFTSKGARTVELRYREAFRTGQITLNGAVSFDDLRPGRRRGYVEATGAFTLPRNFQLSFRGQVVSDPAYLLDYGISDADRLDSRIEITRTRRNEHVSARIIAFNSIREGDINANLPSLVTDLTFHRRFSGGPLGGEGGFRFQTHTHRRASDVAVDSDGDTIGDGRDVARLSARVDWRRSWTMTNGIEATLAAEGAADLYAIRQDLLFAGSTTRLHAAVAAELRWPWMKAGRGGVAHLIEPVLQIVATPSDTENLPNEDSVLVEFDQGNLFALDRFPGSDAVERGFRANLGLSYTRHDPQGWTLGLSLGRVLRDNDLGQFSTASGLNGAQSDWLGAAQLTLPAGLALTTRAIFDDGFDLTKSETRLDLAGEKLAVAASYVWVTADPVENRSLPISELTFDTSYDFDSGWTGKLSGRYDLESDRGTIAGLGLEYRNECMAVDLSLSRRFTSSTSVQPTTDFSLSVDLIGFGGSTAAGPSRVCRR
ncbi:MAG: LPS assembly protein LptD [Rhodobacteraceae bacterium]|jgi:LPS-assembly protein|nr:LPS assembly protein LptD [Paracoccaceae bacterium]